MVSQISRKFRATTSGNIIAHMKWPREKVKGDHYQEVRRSARQRGGLGITVRRYSCVTDEEEERDEDGKEVGENGA